ncbi:type I restriction endonuclease subunit R [Tychonema sp. LEGE 07203]|uniref:type I restriction endonuclease subunit R n=1 Tax=Tychonema sp. LEGE 07203 TaxID=1828671 RepID=UPI001D150D53|nr:type I restriction endonuclease subunit R [Tychonema sp. LEGE 07203]
MTSPHPDSEEALELSTVALFEKLGYTTANCYSEWHSGTSNLGRETRSEVVLISKLQPALEKLNPHLPKPAINLAIEQLIRDRNALTLANANREIYHLLKDRIKVTYRNNDGEEITENVTVIDWKNPTNNDFFLASQFWIAGELYARRTDLIGFINGIPLIFIELKASRERVELAYQNNFCDYRKEIPQLFWYNSIVILSNGSISKIGSLSATWEYFSDWKKINSEGEQGIISLETIIRGTCDKTKLLDIVENFTLFSEEQGNLIKLVAKNHQYLGVNNCLEAVENIRENGGKLGVFWHTQGSGKSFSMQFFSQKIHRTITGNWTFIIITDRDDLDNQIYKNFAKTGAVTEPEKTVRANSGEHLKQLLTEDHRYVFTLIQKFRTQKGETYPQLSDRHNIIVIADEAHRSQYDSYAANMRTALPNAGFIGFTGTPLLVGEEATRREFGDYISIYNFRQSIEDGATVPLFYENRIPQLELTNSELNEQIADAIESADLDEAEANKLDREFARELHLITREERLDEIAKDIVAHFLGRGYQGKAMVVSIDRFTAVKMYNKVQHYWQQYLTELQNQLIAANAESDPPKSPLIRGTLNESDPPKSPLIRGTLSESDPPKSPLIRGTLSESDPPLTTGTLHNEFSPLIKGGWGGSPGSQTTPNEHENLTAKIQYIAETDMAVIISSSQNEEEIFNKKGLTIKPHRQRLAKEKPGLDEKFKDANHPLRIVFVCAMWMTGFDAPSCSTIYLDKPMRNHTLMQTIARANRVFGEKTNGLIVDYIGVFRDLQKALAIYGSASGGDVSEGDTPVQSKAALVDELRSAIDLTLQFCTQRGINFDEIQAATEAFALTKLWNDAVELILIDDDSKQRYLALTQNVNKLYKAILPEPASGEFNPSLYAFAEITKRIKSLTPHSDIAEVKAAVEEILDKSIGTSNYIIPASNQQIDLSSIDFEALKSQFASGYKHTETEKLKGIISSQLTQMLRLNKSRMNYLDKFQQMIDQYNAGSGIVETLFAELVEFARELNIEDKRAIGENLSEEELAIFDLLTKPDISLTEKEKLEVKKVAKELLSTLKQETLVLDWRRRQQTKAAVKVAIEYTLDKLPESYSTEVYERKCQEIYQHVYESYAEAGRSIYTAAA